MEKESVGFLDTAKSAKESMQKSSTALKLDQDEFKDTGKLIIENERLKTSVTILHEKLNNLQDSD